MPEKADGQGTLASYEKVIGGNGRPHMHLLVAALRMLPSLPHWLIPSAIARIYIIYMWRHHSWPNLSSPHRFSELVQLRKLNDRDPMMPLMADKIAAKELVASLLGREWIIPTYWSGRELPEQPSWPYPFILKASHGCDQNIICRDPTDWKKARRQSAKWLRRPYGLWLDEWAYRDIPRGYIVEPYLGTDSAVPVDYKIYVFNGNATLIQVHLNRYSDHQWILFDRQWTQISCLGNDNIPAAPIHLANILDGAEKIAAAFDFARIDFYEIAGEPKFGEVTFYPGSGLDPFDPPELDATIGAQWLAGSARVRRAHIRSAHGSRKRSDRWQPTQ